MSAYITNNCTCLSFYFTENREYDHPFIGCLFINDLQYVKLCVNFLHYLNVEPRFGEPDPSSMWAKQNDGGWYKHVEISPPYPVMYLDDIEIHWIHETDTHSLLEKYNRRRERYLQTLPKTVFMLSDGDLCNDLTKEERRQMIIDFTAIPTSIYLSRYSEDKNIYPRVFIVKEWVGATTDRNSSHIPLIHTIGDRVLEYKLGLKTIFK